MTTTPQLSAEVWQRPFVRQHQKWCDDFVVELRLLDVPGPVIGDRLAEVESHCTAAGETPAEAFGDPGAYATDIGQQSPAEPATGVLLITVLTCAQVLATLVGTQASGSWARGEALTYNGVQIGFLALFLLALLTLPRLLRPLVHHPWTVGVPLAVGVPLLALGAALSTRLDLPILLSVPAAPVAIALFVVVVVLACFGYRELARDLDDVPVTSPLPPEPGTPTPRRGGRVLTVVLPASSVPLAYLLLGLWIVIS